MAHVPLSRNLTETINDNINRMCKAELASIPHLPDIPGDCSALVTSLLWQEHLPLKDLMPEEWMHQLDRRFQIHFSWVPPTPSATTSDRERTLCSVTLTCAQPLYGPPVSSSRWGSLTIAYDPQVPDPSYCTDHPEWASVVAARDRAVARAAIEAKWADIQRSTHSVLTAARSLNAAVAAVPAIALYLSDDFKNRLAHVPEKAPRETAEQKQARILGAADTDAITGAAVHGTFLTAANKGA